MAKVRSEATRVAAATRSRIVEATAVLWCRSFRPPTARMVAAAAGVGPTTVVSAYGGMDELLHEVVAREITTLRRVVARADWRQSLFEHGAALHAIDPALTRLPALAVSVHCEGASFVHRAALVSVHTLGALAFDESVPSCCSAFWRQLS